MLTSSSNGCSASSRAIEGPSQASNSSRAAVATPPERIPMHGPGTIPSEGRKIPYAGASRCLSEGPLGKKGAKSLNSNGAWWGNSWVPPRRS